MPTAAAASRCRPRPSFHRTEGTNVQIIRDATIQTRLVQVGLHSDTQTEIRDGLREGDVVVARRGQLTARRRQGHGCFRRRHSIGAALTRATIFACGASGSPRCRTLQRRSEWTNINPWQQCGGDLDQSKSRQLEDAGVDRTGAFPSACRDASRACCVPGRARPVRLGRGRNRCVSRLSLASMGSRSARGGRHGRDRGHARKGCASLIRSRSPACWFQETRSWCGRTGRASKSRRCWSSPETSVISGQVLARLTPPEGMPVPPPGGQPGGPPGGQQSAATVAVQAPAAGIISARAAIIGTTASARADPLFRIVAQGEMELLAETPVKTLAALAVDQPARIEIIGTSELPGKVRLVSTTINPTTQLGQVRLFVGSNSRLRVGAFGRATIDVARRCGPAIPMSAVLYGSGGRRRPGGSGQPDRNPAGHRGSAGLRTGGDFARGSAKATWSWRAPEPSCGREIGCGRSLPPSPPVDDSAS